MKEIISCLLLLMVTLNLDGDETQTEINHLLDFVEHSDCVFIRNNTSYKAVAHIRKKYRYYKKDIKTAEDFIRLSASQSALTRKPYSIQCGESEKILSRSWLLQELNRFRSAGEG